MVGLGPPFSRVTWPFWEPPPPDGLAPLMSALSSSTRAGWGLLSANSGVRVSFNVSGGSQ